MPALTGLQQRKHCGNSGGNKSSSVRSRHLSMGETIASLVWYVKLDLLRSLRSYKNHHDAFQKKLGLDLSGYTWSPLRM